MERIILASSNKNKVREIKEILGEEFEVLSLSDIGFTKEIKENGKTFKDNSLIKAKTLFALYGMSVIADDSGLILDNFPNMLGVHSKRYSLLATDIANREKLLRFLKRHFLYLTPARYVCHITYLSKDCEKHFEGELKGNIVSFTKGNNGFGYDPMFIPLGYTDTLACLGDEIKNKISHRAKALNALKEGLYD